MSHKILVDNWEFKRKVSIINFIFHVWLASSKIEGKFSKFVPIGFSLNKWMFLIQQNVHIATDAAPKDDEVITFFVLFLPGIYIMECVVIWEFKPLNLVWVLIKLLHNTYVTGLFFIVPKYRPTFFLNNVDPELHGEIWDDDIVFGDWKIMDHLWKWWLQ